MVQDAIKTRRLTGERSGKRKEWRERGATREKIEKGKKKELEVFDI